MNEKYKCSKWLYLPFKCPVFTTYDVDDLDDLEDVVSTFQMLGIHNNGGQPKSLKRLYLPFKCWLFATFHHLVSSSIMLYIPFKQKVIPSQSIIMLFIPFKQKVVPTLFGFSYFWYLLFIPFKQKVVPTYVYNKPIM